MTPSHYLPSFLRIHHRLSPSHRLSPFHHLIISLMLTFIPPKQPRRQRMGSYAHYVLLAIVVIVSVGFIYTSSHYISDTINEVITTTTQSVTNTAAKVVGTTIGTPMTKDDQWNINIMLVGYGGDRHSWGHLTDSIIVASYNPTHHSVSMISIPRDMIINDGWRVNKINTVFANRYSRKKDLSQAANGLSEKLTEILWLEIPYYALIDFNGFEQLIDTLWGLEIDIPKTIVDYKYPWPRYTYQTFRISAGPQTIDGATALKYTRSRYSTSDFDRSQRQQLIIKATIDKMSSRWVSATTFQWIYQLYTKYIHTNISLDEFVGLLRYGNTIPTIHQFGLTTECSNTDRKRTKTWCLLYPVIQENFNGMSGMLPFWASQGKISFYDYTRWFGRFVTAHGGAYQENQSITIYNSIDSDHARQYRFRDGVATNLALLLKRHGLNITTVDNATPAQPLTKAIVYGTGDYKDTIATLQSIIPLTIVEIFPGTVDIDGNEIASRIDLYLGNDFIDRFGDSRFSTYFSHAQ